MFSPVCMIVRCDSYNTNPLHESTPQVVLAQALHSTVTLAEPPLVARTIYTPKALLLDGTEISVEAEGLLSSSDPARGLPKVERDSEEAKFARIATQTELQHVKNKLKAVPAS